MFTYHAKRFETVFKLATVFTRIAKIVLIVIVGMLGVAVAVVPFLPQSLLTFDVSDVTVLPIEMMNIQINIPNTVLEGEIMIKWFVFFALIAAGILVGFLIFVFHLLAKILTDVGEKNPFSEDNVQRLFKMAIGFVVAALVLPLVMLGASWNVVRLLAVDATVNYSVHGEWLFMGLLLYLLASIFQYGKQLQDEVDQTV